MLPNNSKFKYDMCSIPFFFTTHIKYSKHYDRILTRKFYRNMRSSSHIVESDILDVATGITYGEMSLYVLYTKNLKRLLMYNKKKIHSNKQSSSSSSEVCRI